MVCTKISLQKAGIITLKSKVMVEKQVFSEAFKRMVAKAYYTSNKFLAKIGEGVFATFGNVDR